MFSNEKIPVFACTAFHPRLLQPAPGFEDVRLVAQGPLQPVQIVRIVGCVLVLFQQVHGLRQPAPGLEDERLVAEAGL